jgi:hypothetical protein
MAEMGNRHSMARRLATLAVAYKKVDCRINALKLKTPKRQFYYPMVGISLRRLFQLKITLVWG